jgi:dienelactone hydrolase
MKRFFGFILILGIPAFTFGAIRTEVIQYKHGGAVLEGYLAYDDSISGKRPGVLVVHEWWGLNEYARKRADQLAGLGYVAFALDMYGKGVVATDAKKAGELSSFYKSDRQLMRGRAIAGMRTLMKNSLVDDNRVAAIGYCFGGTTVLELARSGADVSGVVSFHGGLETPSPAEVKGIKAKVLVLHGGDDAYVPVKEVQAFEDEMKKAKADWQINIYSQAVHAFTNPAAGNDPSKGVAYNATADKRSWEAMKLFFNEIFSK